MAEVGTERGPCAFLLWCEEGASSELYVVKKYNHSLAGFGKSKYRSNHTLVPRAVSRTVHVLECTTAVILCLTLYSVISRDEGSVFFAETVIWVG